MHHSAKIETLIEKLTDWYKDDERYPPENGDIDDVEHVAQVFIEDMRWGTHYEWIYKLDDDEVYAAVADVQPATEEQDWGDYGKPSIYAVEPYEVTVTRYKKIQPTEAK